uniref:Uncharacterized protein n=1 Tax=Micrurus carvalhoi TaxID=3147026 RepID=A0A2H6NL54_9SAUR
MLLLPVPTLSEVQQREERPNVRGVWPLFSLLHCQDNLTGSNLGRSPELEVLSSELSKSCLEACPWGTSSHFSEDGLQRYVRKLGRQKLSVPVTKVGSWKRRSCTLTKLRQGSPQQPTRQTFAKQTAQLYAEVAGGGSLAPSYGRL